MPESAAAPTSTFGDTLRYWRRVRAMSQLDLSAAAATTPRHMSFLETGRSQPSREMVLRLATAMDVPLRDRNGLLLAAGYAPVYAERGLGDPALDRVAQAVDQMLRQHEPFPAVLLDRGWDLLQANAGAERLFGALFAPQPLPETTNVLRLVLEPGPVRDGITNWDELAPTLLERARREAVGGVLDVATAELVRELQRQPEVAALLVAPPTITPMAPVIDVQFDLDGSTLRFFSVVSTVGTPVDVTAQELRIEAFFPADEDTASTWAAGG